MENASSMMVSEASDSNATMSLAGDKPLRGYMCDCEYKRAPIIHVNNFFV